MWTGGAKERVEKQQQVGNNTNFSYLNTPPIPPAREPTPLQSSWGHQSPVWIHPFWSCTVTTLGPLAVTSYSASIGQFLNYLSTINSQHYIHRDRRSFLLVRSTSTATWLHWASSHQDSSLPHRERRLLQTAHRCLNLQGSPFRMIHKPHIRKCFTILILSLQASAMRYKHWTERERARTLLDARVCGRWLSACLLHYANLAIRHWPRRPWEDWRHNQFLTSQCVTNDT